VTREHGDSVSVTCDRRLSAPRAAGLAFVVAPILVVAGILLARLIIEETWERITTYDVEGAPYARFRALGEALPQIAAAPNSALLLGFCFSEKGFIPEAFDDRMLGTHGRRLTTFSFATAAVHSSTVEALARAIGSVYRSAGTRPEVVLVELSASMLSPESAEWMAARVGYNRTLRGLLVRDLDEWVRASVSSASFGIEILGNWLLGGPTKVYTSSLFCNIGLDRHATCQALAPRWWPWPSQDGEYPIQAETYRVWSRLAPALREENGEHALSWSLEQRGFIRRIPDSLRSEHDAYARERAAGFDDVTIGGFTRYDREVVNQFSTDGEGFQKYLAALQELQSLGTKVVVYIGPRANFIIANPQDARLLQGFFDAAAQRINALGMPVVQMNSMSYELNEFQNTWALLSEDTGGPRFSRELADVVDAVLEGAPLPPRLGRFLPSGHTAGPAASAEPAQDPFWRSAVDAQP
jgi:hypothetical protein